MALLFRVLSPRWAQSVQVVALLVGLPPVLASAQEALPPQLSVGGNITFTREQSVTQFELAEPQAQSVTIRIINERARKSGSLSFAWATALLQSQEQVLRLFSVDDMQMGYAFTGVNQSTSAGCIASAERRTTQFSSYVLRCVSNLEEQRARNDSGAVIYEIDIFLYSVTNNSLLDRFMVRASLPGRLPLIVFLR